MSQPNEGGQQPGEHQFLFGAWFCHTGRMSQPEIGQSDRARGCSEITPEIGSSKTGLFLGFWGARLPIRKQ
jgi:hypothetical protein